MKRTKLGLILVILVVGLYFLISGTIDFSSITDIEYLQNTVRSYGIWSPLVFIVIMALAVIISPIPSMPLDMAAGAVWGPLLGSLYAVIGAEIGAIISFLLARNLGRPFIEKVMKVHIDFCDKCLDKNIAWIIFFTRLFPFFQFDIISYGAGLSKVTLKRFAIATFFGMIPMTYVFARFGTAIALGSWVSIILSLALIVSMFIVPTLLKKYNLFNINKTIGEK